MDIDSFPPLTFNTESDQHPNQLPNPHHRKIELQSPLDLTYLRDNITRAAQARLDLHFPPDAITPSRTDSPSKTLQDAHQDPMRALVSTLVTSYLDRTFTLASPSLSINGNELPIPNHSLNSAPSQRRTLPKPLSETKQEQEGTHFTYTAYDANLSTKLASLNADLERETLAVSNLRRKAPAKAAAEYGDALIRAVEEDGNQAGADADQEEDEKREVGLRLAKMPKGWAEENAATYEAGLAELRRLVGGVAAGERETGGDGVSLTETVGKAQRARDVALEFE